MFAAPFCIRPDSDEDDVLLGHRSLLRLTARCCPSAALQRGLGSEAAVLIRTGRDETSCEDEAMWGNRTT